MRRFAPVGSQTAGRVVQVVGLPNTHQRAFPSVYIDIKQLSGDKTPLLLDILVIIHSWLNESLIELNGARRYTLQAHVEFLKKGDTLTFNQLFLAVEVLKCTSDSEFLDAFFAIWTQFQHQHTN